MLRRLTRWLSVLAVIGLVAQPWLAAASGTTAHGISPELQRLFADLGVICHPGGDARSPGGAATGQDSDGEAHHEMCARCVAAVGGVAVLLPAANPPPRFALGAGPAPHVKSFATIRVEGSLGPRGPPV